MHYYTEKELWQAYYTGYTKGWVRTRPLKTQEDVEALLAEFYQWIEGVNCGLMLEAVKEGEQVDSGF